MSLNIEGYNRKLFLHYYTDEELYKFINDILISFNPTININNINNLENDNDYINNITNL